MESRTSGLSLTQVSFYTQRKVEFGQALYVCGSIPTLGEWNPRNAVKLEWSKGDNWKKNLLLPVPSDIEYKFIVTSYDQENMREVYWDEGPNRKMSLFPHSNGYSATKSISVMSFNIRGDHEGDGSNRWQYRKDHVANTIKLYGCDFVGVQEALFHQLIDLSSMLPTYMCYGRGRGEKTESGEAVPIFYLHDKWELVKGNTFWLSDMPEIPASTTFGNVTPRICTWAIFKEKFSKEEVFVINAQLDNLNVNSQRESAKLLSRFINTISVDFKKIILTGDFNVDEDDVSIEIIKGDGVKLREALADIVPEKKDRREKGTLHYWTGAKDSIRVDYIFVSPALRTKDFKIIYDNIKGKYPSNHFPIVGVFTT